MIAGEGGLRNRSNAVFSTLQMQYFISSLQPYAQEACRHVGDLTVNSDRLTRREREIAEAYADGASYRDIAGRLFISPATVRTHLRTIYRKLGVTSKVKLLKELDGSTASPSLRESGAKATHTSFMARARSRPGPEASSRAVGHGLLGRVGRLREDALLALSDGLFGPEQVEPQWRASEVDCRALIEALPAVVLLKDHALRYVFANRFFLGQWGLRLEDVIGRNQQEVFSGGLGFAWSRATDERDASVLETGQETGFYVVRVPTGAGRERKLWARKLPVRSAGESDHQVLTLGIDITPLGRLPEEISARVPSVDIPLPPAIAARLSPAQRSARILMVDAEPEVRRLAIIALERAGHTVETAASGREAFALLGMRTFDLFVSDLAMRDLDGLSLHDVLAARQPEMFNRFILTCRPPISAELQDFLSRRAVEVLEKPFSATDIVTRVDAKVAGVKSGAHP